MQVVEVISVPSTAALFFGVGLNEMKPNVIASYVGLARPT
jgi:hypothetical protein